MNTVLITGCSSGFGLETARCFLERGWQVVATMRSPREDVLPPSPRLRVLQLDVTDAEGIRKAIDAAGRVDVLVNNAGFAAPAPFELTTMETVRALFETNTFGTIAVTQAVLPQMRARGSGVIVNVTSGVTYKPLPLVGVYRASKAAVNAFTESLANEVEQFGVRVRIVLPGSSAETRFRDTARTRLRGIDDDVYGEFMKQAMERMTASAGVGTRAKDVAEAVWRAATDPSVPMHIPAGADAIQWAGSLREDAQRLN
ncbi:SDR family oxidoreductase [Bordetella flabilis]|uniref:Short-chain dehydrogenase/reductase n=1 Tax=Bordetella flabilis TaxID=463014 RepID=A0A193GLP7_9BORD|nr:SDR family oxidoreductase [Bordetella flabilis]ANN80199.1 short-chain dehydrogenase/reductase [Bordetella flabilis]